MLTVKQVSAALGVSATCVYQLVAQGKLAHHRIGLGRGAIRISEIDLKLYLDSCRQELQAGAIPFRPMSAKPTYFKHLNLEA